MLKEKKAKLIVDIFKNKTYIEIAKELDVSRNTISDWSSDPEVMNEVRNQAMNYFGAHLPAITANMLNLAFNSRSDNVRFLATQDILNRIGMENAETNDELFDITDIFKKAIDATERKTESIDTQSSDDQ